MNIDMADRMGPEAEFKEFDCNNSWPMVYHAIREKALQNHDYSLKDARRQEFRGRNRYRDVSPYDHSRVQLDRDEIDYINASLVECQEANRKYILTQGPLPLTAGHFWAMIWECQTLAIVMLNRLVELGRGPLVDTSSHFWLMVWEQQSAAILMLNRVIEKGMVKCHQYFPMGSENEDEDSLVFDQVGLTVSFVCEDNANYYTVRTLEIHDNRTGESRRVLQFHYTTWPDFGVPESPAAFLNFLFAVRESGALNPDVGPPVIHCSAGIGRSGTFCLVDSCLILIEKNNDPNCVDIQSILLDMRQYRMGLIQTPDQLRFSYLAIIEGSKRLLSPSPDSGIEVKVGNIFQETPPNEEDEGYQNGAQNGASGRICENDSPPSTPPPLPPRRGRVEVSRASPRKDSYPHVNTPSDLGNTTIGDVLDSYSGTTETVELIEDKNTEELEMDKLRQEGIEIRRRNREEKRKRTEEQVAKMKKKQQEHEKWQSQRRHIQPYMIGLSVAVMLGGYLFYHYYLS